VEEPAKKKKKDKKDKKAKKESSHEPATKKQKLK